MAKASFYAVYITRDKNITYEDVKKEMNLAVDWYRLKENFWILYTTSDAEKWYSRLSPFVKVDGRVFICRLDPNDRQGWMDKGFWKFVRREKEDT